MQWSHWRGISIISPYPFLLLHVAVSYRVRPSSPFSHLSYSLHSHVGHIPLHFHSSRSGAPNIHPYNVLSRTPLPPCPHTRIHIYTLCSVDSMPLASHVRFFLRSHFFHRHFIQRPVCVRFLLLSHVPSARPHFPSYRHRFFHVHYFQQMLFNFNQSYVVNVSLLSTSIADCAFQLT